MPRMLLHTLSDRRSVSVITEAQKGPWFLLEREACAGFVL